MKLLCYLCDHCLLCRHGCQESYILLILVEKSVLCITSLCIRSIGLPQQRAILNSLTDARNQSNASVLCGMSVFCIEEHMVPRKVPVSRWQSWKMDSDLYWYISPSDGVAEWFRSQCDEFLLSHKKTDNSPCTATGSLKFQLWISSITLEKQCFQFSFQNFNGFHNQSASLTYKQARGTRARSDCSKLVWETTVEEANLLKRLAWVLLEPQFYQNTIIFASVPSNRGGWHAGSIAPCTNRKPWVWRN